MNNEGGLSEHSIEIADTLLKLRAALAPEISEESCGLIGIFHDIRKVGIPGKPYYSPEVKDSKSTGASYTINPQISQHIPLSDSETQAIAYYDGMHVPEGRLAAHKEEPLLLLLHWADMWSSVREREHA